MTRLNCNNLINSKIIIKYITIICYRSVALLNLLTNFPRFTLLNVCKTADFGTSFFSLKNNYSLFFPLSSVVLVQASAKFAIPNDIMYYYPIQQHCFLTSRENVLTTILCTKSPILVQLLIGKLRTPSIQRRPPHRIIIV